MLGSARHTKHFTIKSLFIPTLMEKSYMCSHSRPPGGKLTEVWWQFAPRGDLPPLLNNHSCWNEATWVKCPALNHQTFHHFRTSCLTSGATVVNILQCTILWDLMWQTIEFSIFTFAHTQVIHGFFCLFSEIQFTAKQFRCCWFNQQERVGCEGIVSFFC